MKSRKILRVILALAVLAALGAGAWRARRAQAATSLAVAPVRKGDFLVIVRCRGELKARRSVQLTAPVNVPDLQIVWLATAGDPVKTGQPVIRFDPSSARQDRKSTRLNSSHSQTSNAVFCLKNKKYVKSSPKITKKRRDNPKTTK